MIVTFWLYAACLLDTPERKIKMEARRIAEALEKYYTKKIQTRTQTGRVLCRSFRKVQQ